MATAKSGLNKLPWIIQQPLFLEDKKTPDFPGVFIKLFSEPTLYNKSSQDYTPKGNTEKNKLSGYKKRNSCIRFFTPQ